MALEETAHARSVSRLMLHKSDLDLMRRARARDLSARDLLVERMRCLPRVLHAKNRRAGSPLSPEDLADLAQDAFALVWQRADGYRGDSKLETWAAGIALNLFRNAVRRRRSASLAEDAPVISREEPEDSQLGEVLLEAIATLDENQATVVHMRHFGELSFDEIAAEAGVPVGTAKSRYSRALSALRNRLSLRRLQGEAP